MTQPHGTLICFNNKDIDSVTAANIAAIWTNTVPQTMYRLTPYKEVVDVDFDGYDVIFIGKVCERASLVQLVGKANSIVYIGNNTKSINLCKDINQLCPGKPLITIHSNTFECLSSLVWKLFYPDIKLMPYVVEYLVQHIVGVGSLPNKLAVITALRSTMRRVSLFKEILAYNLEEIDRMAELGNTILAEHARLAENIALEATVQNFLGYEVIVAAAPEILVPAVTHRLRKNKPFTVVYTDADGHRTFRLCGELPDKGLLALGSKLGEARGNDRHVSVRVPLPTII